MLPNTADHTTAFLSQTDEELFTTGKGCHVFAVCLFEVFAYPLRLLRNTSCPQPGGIVHVYCLPVADVMIDFRGPASEQSYLRANCYDSPPYYTETVSLRRIEELRVQRFGRGGLYAESRFVQVARLRAFAAILADKSKYEHAV